MIDEISWQQWANLPQMSKLPLHEVEKQYRIYLNEVTEQRIAFMMMQEAVSQQEAMAVAASNGGGSYIQQISNDGCIQIVANTFDSTNFEVIVGTSTETTYTVDWGDGTTGEGTLLAEDTTIISHSYENESQEYTIRLCFANASAVTSLEFEGND